jgi:hypothetical protein
MGRRITVPAREATTSWRWIAAAAAVALLLGGSWAVSLSLLRIGESERARSTLDELLSGMALRPSAGDAPESLTAPPTPKYPLILADSLHPDRLTEGVWTYKSATTYDEVITKPWGGVRIRMSRTTYKGRPVWMVNVARSGGEGPSIQFPETSFVEASSLRPVYAVAHGPKRPRFVQTFSSDSASQSIEFRNPKFNLKGVMSLPFPPTAAFTNDGSLSPFRVLLPAFPLARGWQGSLYQTGLFSKSDSGTLEQHAVPLDLRVVGKDRVTVPAGTFNCWRVEMETHAWETERWTIWVSRDLGWLVKMQHRGSDHVTNEWLESYEPLE